ncbi:hypothetical protein M405DRAFT_828035 [Rhizopogon salebrosus TDB-379]|nr:hypothetical protein M405DRAFT_828035 [Rhizopogon salebrosus TDB-379]
MFAPSFAFLSVLSSLGALCHRPQDAVMKLQRASNDLLDSSIFTLPTLIARPISQLNNLHKLTTWDLGNQIIEHPMQLQTLQVLSLNSRVSSAWERRSRNHSPGGLECLRLPPINPSKRQT